MYDLEGKIVPRTLVKNERQLRYTRDGGSEIDAETAFSQVVSTIDKVFEATSNIRGKITHVAQCAFWHTLVGIDVKGGPTTSVLGWADNRSREAVGVLRKKFSETEVHHRTGTRFHSSYWPAKLLWLRTTQPDAFARTDRWLSLSDFIALKLFGYTTTSVSMASATGIFDLRKCEWDGPLLRSLRVSVSNLPVIAEDGLTFRLNEKYRRRWPRLADARWFPAIGDGAANNIGSGCVKRSRAALMVGTSGAMRVAFRGDPPVDLPSGLWCYRIDRKRVIVGGALSDGGGLYSWIKENLRLPKNVASAIQKRAPQAHRLIFLPFLAGERSTGYHENATGAILGLTSSTDTIDIAQAAMEAVAYRFAEIVDQLSSITKIDEIIVSGGALRSSKVWAQIIADVLGRELTLVDAPEASLRGTVLLALESLGNIERIEELAQRGGKVFEPDANKHAILAEARKRSQEIYDLIINNL